MTTEEIFVTIKNAKARYIENNGKDPDYVIISQNLYFSMVRAYYCPDCAEEYPYTTICGMKIKLIGDKDFLIVGCTEILGLKGEKDIED